MDEIEIRGKTSKEGFKKLRTFLEENAELTDQYDRLTIDVSPGFDTKTKTWQNPSGTDLRLKKSGKNEKIVVKIGHWSDKKRGEFEIDLKEGELIDALRLFEALGYKTGMVYEWKSRIYKYKDFEIKISEYPKGYYDWEIESLNPESDPDELAAQLSLKPFSEDDYSKEFTWKNNNLHELYSLEKVTEILEKS